MNFHNFQIKNILLAQSVIQRSINGYPKMEKALYNISSRSWSLPTIPDVTKFDFIYNLTSIFAVRRDKTYMSELTPIKSLTGNVVNSGNVSQKMFTAEYSESYSKSSSLTTTSSTESSNEISGGVKIGTEVGGLFFKIKTEFSLSYTRRWGSSSSSSETETNSTTITVRAPPQEVVVNPFSRVNVTTDFFSFTGTVQYLIDFRLDNYVNYFAEMDSGNFSSSINMARYETDLNAIPFENEDAKIACINGECFLKDVPIIVDETGYHIETKFGDQEPLEF